MAELIDAAVAGHQVPGAAGLAGRGSRTVARWVAGHADTTPGAVRPMRADTVFDLASLTKVIATTTTVLALAGQGLLALNDVVTGYLPGFAACERVTIRHLLTHTSGLPASRMFYRWCTTKAELLDDMYRMRLMTQPGTEVAYSDLGFIVLGEIIATVTGEPLDRAVRRLVTGPLGLAATGFNPPRAPWTAAPGFTSSGFTSSGFTVPGFAASGFAATERGGDGAPLAGVVHDENARVMDGVAGHAGLFSTAADLAAFARWWVSNTNVVVPGRPAAAGSQVPDRGHERPPRLRLGLPRRPPRHRDGLAGHVGVAHRLHRHQPRPGSRERVLARPAHQRRSFRP